MKRLVYVFLATVCLVSAVTSNGFAQIDSETLFDKMVEARGGAEKLGAIKTSVMKGKIVMVLQGGVTGDITITRMNPDKLLLEIGIVGTVISQGYDGQTAWMDNPLAGGFHKLADAEAESMKRDANSNDAFLNPAKYGIEYAYEGTITEKDTKYHVMEQVFPNGSRTTMYVDMESYLVYRTIVNRGSDKQALVEEAYYSDYRNTDGITQAHHVSVLLNGQETSKYLFDQVYYDSEIDASIFAPTEDRFSREKLIADTRQLAAIIEDTHPDPYKHIGGKIAFHRHLQNILRTIPDEGMTNSEFSGLIRPFMAAIGDAHTEIYAHHAVDPMSPGGLPLKFGIAGQSLYVSAVPGEQYESLLGAILVSVKDVSMDELARRLRNIKPIDNQYHLLWHFTATYLWYGPYLRELLPEWTDTNRIKVKLQSASAEIEEVVFELPMNVASLFESESRIALPSAEASGLKYDFLDQDKQTAYLRIDHMQYYRESFEARNSLGIANTLREEIDTIPSATEFFKSMVSDMKDAGTETMIVDLRRNGGGDALMADILLYFLYGKDTTLSTRWNNINRLSKIYLDSRESVTLEELNQERNVPWIEGDYDFSEDYSDNILSDDSALGEGFKLTPTFYSEWESESFEGHYCPANVVVLTRPGTFSAGFGVAIRLYRAGGILVGTPSGQAPNSGGNAIRWTLSNTGITGRVSQSYVLNFPDDSELARVLPVQYPLTYELLAFYEFDPNAEVLYAIDLLPKLSK